MINGMGDITASLFISNLKSFYEFYNSLKIDIDIKTETEPKIDTKIENKYKDNIYVFSGIRDKNLEKIITSSGGIISSTVSKKTTLVIVKSYDEETVKVKNAKLFNIPIIIYDEFIK